ncbi:craniofacial development protein 2-like [Nymphalis io]|uniref:craniofacial development protein 2-like n=1 Tax=Inachis io TaxID=171585 RepID=UPI002168BF5B|nr:craniofacial development protein 2-like [Nymphalis io]
MQDNRNVRLPDDPRSDRRFGFSGTQSVKLATGRGNVGNQASPGKQDWKTTIPIAQEHPHDSSSYAGVAIAISKQWTKAVLGYNPVSDRIITMELGASPTPLNIIQVYAPTSAAKDEDVESFYNDIESSIAKIPNSSKYGLGERNARGERLLQFAADNNLTIINTVFQQHHRRLYTWTTPDGKHRNQIDYILIRSRWRSSIMNAHTLPGADCQSDHQLLVCNLKLKLRSSIPRKTSKKLEIVDQTAFINKLLVDSTYNGIQYMEIQSTR